MTLEPKVWASKTIVYENSKPAIYGIMEKSPRKALHCVGEGDCCKARQKILSCVARTSVWMRGPTGANSIDTPTALGGLEEIEARKSASNSASAPRE